MRDPRLLAQLLARLGASQLSDALSEIADAARSGSFQFDNEAKTLIDRACADVRAMRLMLMRALGLRLDDDERDTAPDALSLQGLILYVATEGFDLVDRHLGTVRDLLTMGQDETEAMFHRMSTSLNRIVAAVGGMCLQKDPKLLSNVFASAQSHTHFLNSPRIRESLSTSSFRFEDLKSGPTTIYLVLPADRLGAFGRWLRLLMAQAIIVNARNIADNRTRPSA